MKETKTTTVLGIESSCDECSASVVDYEGGRFRVRGLATYSQVKLHQPFGGVVPEIASRNHLETIQPMIDEAIRQSGKSLSDLDAIAVTNRPGLVGALLVGLTAAKALAYALRKPLVPVHHLEGHALSVFLDREDRAVEVGYPLLLAVVSGGHTQLCLAKGPPELWPPDFLAKSTLARSKDDAAGEAFDKTAKLLGFPYPGGIWLDRAAREGKGNPKAFTFARAVPAKDTLDFSFSGLKTAVALQVRDLEKRGELESRKSDLCASIQEAIVDQLLSKIATAARSFQCRSLAIVGGVAANSRLRERLAAEWRSMGIEFAPLFPQLKYCTDNAAMIAASGLVRHLQGQSLQTEHYLELNAVPYPEV